MASVVGDQTTLTMFMEEKKVSEKEIRILLEEKREMLEDRGEDKC